MFATLYPRAYFNPLPVSNPSWLYGTVTCNRAKRLPRQFLASGSFQRQDPQWSHRIRHCWIIVISSFAWRRSSWHFHLEVCIQRLKLTEITVQSSAIFFSNKNGISVHGREKSTTRVYATVLQCNNLYKYPYGRIWVSIFLYGLCVTPHSYICVIDGNDVYRHFEVGIAFAIQRKYYPSKISGFAYKGWQ